MLLCSSCDKDSNSITDITKNKWALKYFEVNNKKYNSSSEYFLEFVNDTLFYFYLSINKAGGIYKINEGNQISIQSFHPFTELCCENEFDHLLLDNFIKVKDFKTEGKNLFFSSENLTFKFNIK